MRYKRGEWQNVSVEMGIWVEWRNYNDRNYNFNLYPFTSFLILSFL